MEGRRKAQCFLNAVGDQIWDHERNVVGSLPKPFAGFTIGTSASSANDRLKVFAALQYWKERAREIGPSRTVREVQSRLSES